MGTTLDVRIKRANKVYHYGEVLSGVVVITSKDSVQHQGISLMMEGSVNLQLSAKSVGVFEAFYNSVKPIQLINSTVEMVKPGKLPSGKTEIPFEFPLQVKGNKVLYETYHGVFVNIQVLHYWEPYRLEGSLRPSPISIPMSGRKVENRDLAAAARGSITRAKMSRDKGHPCLVLLDIGIVLLKTELV
ncbi:UNVERIFIED_CONTAM: Down syndrome critical region protein 3 [Gekko kuhli]